MNSLTDQQLLGDYSLCRSDAAFAELVQRHVDLVYSAALRMVRDPHLAKDVTQGVFAALAQNARQLKDCRVLAGWLHRTAQNIAAHTVRTDVRRRAREQEAATMNELLSPDSNAPWEQIAPHLDAALGELNQADRDAVLLRYFEHKSAIEMSERLGISSEAAQKRVNRAVERLREFFVKRGVTIGAGGLVVAISANAVQSAPFGLSTTISTAIAGTTIAATTTAIASKAIAMTALQKTITTAALTAVIGIAIYESTEASKLRTRLQASQQTLASQGQMAGVEREKALQQIAALQTENNRLNRNSTELLKLRGEITRLRKVTPDAAQTLPNKPVEENATNAASFQTISNSFQAELNWGQTLVGGGWKIPSGQRVFIFATPQPGQSQSQLAMQMKIAEVGDVELPASGPDSFTGIMESDQYNQFLTKLRQAGAFTMRDMNLDSLMSGQQAIIAVNTAGENDNDSMVALLPTISADGKTVNLEITPTLNYPTVAATK